MWGVRTCGVVVGQLHRGFPGQERRSKRRRRRGRRRRRRRSRLGMRTRSRRT